MADEDVDNPLIECTLLDALNYRPLAPRLTRKRLQLRKYYHSFLFQLFFKGAPLLMLIVLPFFENQHSFSWSSDYQGKEENSGDNKSYFWTRTALEVVFLSIVTIDAVLRWFMLFPSRKSGREIKDLYCKLDYYAAEFRLSIAYIIILLITWPLLFASIGMYAKNGYTDQLILVTFIRQLVRPMFLIAQIELIRKAIKAIFLTFLQLFSVNILLILVIFLFAMIGLIIFPRHLNYNNNETITINTFTVEEGDTYFNSLSQAYWNLLVYLTTSNSPDIVTPAYKHHRVYFLYFGTYFFITHYFLLKVIIALYAVRFMSFLNDSMCKSYKNRLTNLCVAFALMTKENVDNTRLDPEHFFSSNTKVKTKDLKMYAKKIKLVLDEQEFNNICNTLVNYQLNWEDFKDRLLRIFEYFRSSSDSLHKLEDIILACPFGDKSPFCCYSSYLIIQMYVAFTSLPLAIIHTITLTVLIVKDFDNSLTNPRSTMTTALLAFSFILIPEFIVRICLIIAMSNIYQRRKVRNKNKCSCFTFKEWFLKGHRNRFSPELKQCFSIIVYIVDLLLLLTIIILGFVHVPCLRGQCLSGSNLFQLLQANIILVSVRLLRMTTMNRMFARVIHTLLHILILLTPFILLAYLLYYEFAVLGMTIFRNSNFTDASAITRCGSYENLYYYPYNFEDFFSSLVTLWNLMIVNNWYIIVDAYVRGTTSAATIYFVIWWLLMETVLNGVLYGVLIEIITKVIDSELERFKNAKNISEKIKVALIYYLAFDINDSPFSYSLIDAWNIRGLTDDNKKRKKRKGERERGEGSHK